MKIFVVSTFLSLVCLAFASLEAEEADLRLQSERKEGNEAAEREQGNAAAEPARTKAEDEVDPSQISPLATMGMPSVDASQLSSDAKPPEFLRRAGRRGRREWDWSSLEDELREMDEKADMERKQKWETEQSEIKEDARSRTPSRRRKSTSSSSSSSSAPLFPEGDERLKSDPFSLKSVAVSHSEMDYETKIE